MSVNHFLAYLACRRRDRPQTSLTINLVLDRKSGQYRRYFNFEQSAKDEVNLDSYTGYKTALEDVYIAQPRLDFAFSSRPVRYQLGAASYVPDPEFLLFLKMSRLDKLDLRLRHRRTQDGSDRLASHTFKQELDFRFGRLVRTTMNTSLYTVTKRRMKILPY
jgi:hypothetical protein